MEIVQSIWSYSVSIDISYWVPQERKKYYQREIPQQWVSEKIIVLM